MGPRPTNLRQKSTKRVLLTRLRLRRLSLQRNFGRQLRYPINKLVRPVVEKQKWPKFIRVRVLDPIGQPINKAKVMRSIDQETTEFSTDSQGRVEIPTTDDAPNSTSFTISADVEPFVVFYIWWRFGKAPSQSEYVFRLEEGREVGGSVVDENEVPIVGANVLVKFSPDQDGRSWPRPGYPKFTATTDDSGKWQIGRIPKKLSSIQLQFSSNSYICDSEPGWDSTYLDRLVAGTHTRVMRVGSSLSGRVTDEDGKPVAGVKLRLADDAFADHIDMPETDADGRFEFPNCAAMKTILLGYKPSFAPFAKIAQHRGNRSISRMPNE